MLIDFEPSFPFASSSSSSSRIHNSFFHPFNHSHNHTNNRFTNPFTPFIPFGLGGSGNMFGDFDEMDVDDGHGFGGMPGVRGPGQGQSFRTHSFASPNIGRKHPHRQDPAIEHDLYVTLEEVMKGTVKKMKITRRVLNPDGKTSRKEDKVLTINVKPGWKAGTKITFQKEGDQNPGSLPADIIFIIRDKPHPLFKRDGADIKYTAKITLREALCGTRINVPTLNNETIPLRIPEVVKPTTVRRIPGHGLPYAKEPSKRGDLIVNFDIKFPESLNESTRQILWDCLP